MNERKEAAAKAKAEIAYGQAFWYGWGRVDSGQYRGRTVDVCSFATKVKADTLAFELEQTHYLESIQGAWQKFVEKELP